MCAQTSLIAINSIVPASRSIEFANELVNLCTSQLVSRVSIVAAAHFPVEKQVANAIHVATLNGCVLNQGECVIVMGGMKQTH